MLPAQSLLTLACLVALLPTFGAAEDGSKRKSGSSFVPVKVVKVVQVEESWAVILEEPEQQLLLPIFVGHVEGAVIRLRLERAKAPRPMTHDLLDEVIAALGATVVRVEVDDLKDGVFLGRVTLRRGSDRALILDARPSDSIALALGSGATIYVARSVLRRAGVTSDDLKSGRPMSNDPGAAQSL